MVNNEAPLLTLEAAHNLLKDLVGGECLEQQGVVHPEQLHGNLQLKGNKREEVLT